MKKRIFAIFLLIICLMSFVVTSFATDFLYTVPYTVTYDSSSVDQGVNTLDSYYSIRNTAATQYGVDVFSFEVLYQRMGIQRPSQINYPVSLNSGNLSWPIPYDFYSSDNSSLTPDVVLRFYVSSIDWDFELRWTYNETAFFSSSNQVPGLTSSGVPYYDVVVSFSSSDLVNVSRGWFIYSNELVPNFVPGQNEGDTFTATFNYYYNSSLVGSESLTYNYTTYPFYQTLSAPSGYAVLDESYRQRGFYFPNGITSNFSQNIQVITINELVDQKYNLGYSSGEAFGYENGYNAGNRSGYQSGYAAGQQDFINSGAYQALLDEAYDRGYFDAVEEGAASGYPPITNPLRFVTQPVIQFLRIQVYPGLQLGVLFLAAIGVSLLVVFLKIFAGG